MKKNICVQLTTRHSIKSSRLFYRMHLSLLKAGCHSMVIGPDTDVENQEPNQALAAIRTSRNKMLDRIIRPLSAVKWTLVNPVAAVQIHDPDLVPLAWIPRLFGKRIIYDIHDDYQASIKARFKNHRLLAQLLAGIWSWLEHGMAHTFNDIIVADRHLAAKFKKHNPVILGNYPKRDFTRPSTHDSATFNLIYVGGVNKARGVEIALEALQSLSQPDIRFDVIGDCYDLKIKQKMENDPRVQWHGRIPWVELETYYRKSNVGLALYQPIPSFTYCTGENAVKIIEYMAAGIPVLCSDFPGLIDFVEKPELGLTVKPDSAEKVADKINRLYDNRAECRRLGENARKVFENHMNWEQHEHKLLELYLSLT